MLRYTWILLILLVQVAVADPERKLPGTLSHRPQFEVELCPAGTELTPGAEGEPEQAMALCCELYQMAGPRLGQTFVDSCYLLALGDLRPYAGWNGFVPEYQPADEETFDRLNRYLVPRGLSLHPEAPGWREDGRVGNFSLYSLSGLERRTRECKLKWMPKYSRQDGWPGFYAWQAAAQLAKREHAADQSYHLMEGFRLGYPDSAIWNCDEIFTRPSYSTVDASIDNAGYYRCGKPVYTLRFEDALAPDVLENEKTWSDFLTRAYASSQHQLLAQDAEFQRSRMVAHSGEDGRYLEDSRRPRKAPFQPSRVTDSDSASELWLSRNQPLLLGQIRNSPDTASLAALVPKKEGIFPISNQVVEAWLLRGYMCSDPLTQPLSRLYGELYPEKFLDIYRVCLESAVREVNEVGRDDRPADNCRVLVEPLSAPGGAPWFGRLPEAMQVHFLLALARHREEARVAQLVEHLKAPEDLSPPGQAWKRLKPDQLARNNPESVRKDDFSLQVSEVRLEGQTLRARLTVKNLRKTPLSSFRLRLNLDSDSGPRVEWETVEVAPLAALQSGNLEVNFKIWVASPEAKLPAFRPYYQMQF